MKITVLYGGPSAEREVSLVSGKAVIDALRSIGHEVFASDVSPADLSGLDHPADVIFPVLHGAFGESGELQEILEQRGLKFVGSGSKASRLGMNKVETKKVWEKAGLPTPPYRVIHRGDPIRQTPGSCVVKAIDSGSSIDVHVRKGPCRIRSRTRRTRIRATFSPDTNCPGRKIHRRHRCLRSVCFEENRQPPIRIVPKREFFDYEAEYKASDTEHRFDTGLPPRVVEQLPRARPQSERCRGAARLRESRHHVSDGRESIRTCWKLTPFPGSHRRVSCPKPQNTRESSSARSSIGWSAGRRNE